MLKKQLQLKNGIMIKNQAEAYVHFDKIVDTYDDLKLKYHLLKDENMNIKNGSIKVSIDSHTYGYYNVVLELCNKKYSYPISEYDNNYFDEECVDKFLSSFKEDFVFKIKEIKRNVKY